MFLIYSIEDRLLLKPDDLNYKNDTNIKLYEDIILEKAREKYIGKVKRLLIIFSCFLWNPCLLYIFFIKKFLRGDI